MSNIYTLWEQSELPAGSFIRAVNHITGSTFSAEKFAMFLKSKYSFSDRAMYNLEAGAKKLVDEVLPLHDAMMMNESYANMNPLVVAFYNAVRADPQVQADFEWWAAACKTNEKLKMISHDILGLTLKQ